MRFTLFSYLLIFATLANAQVAKYSNEFLSIGVGAKSMAMANSTQATVSDAGAAYWNPANMLYSQSKIQFALMHAQYFNGIANYDYVGSTYKLNDSVSFGFSLIRFGIDDIMNTLNLVDNNGNFNYNNISTFAIADYAVLFSVAKKTKIKNLNFGANIKLIYRQQGEFASAYGFGIDLAANYEYRRWKFGISAQNITSTFNVWIFNNSQLEKTFAATNNDLPKNTIEITLPKFLLGVARNIQFAEKFEIMSEFGADLTVDGKRTALVKSKLLNIEPHLGIETNYKRLVYLRAGVGNIYKYADFENNTSYHIQPSLGAGLKIKNFTIDYAITNIGDNAFISNIFSLNYAFR